jgi:hypothetical protein
MLQKLGDHIRACYERATDAAKQAEEATDEEAKTLLLHMEKTWTHLAKSYEFVQSLESFLLDADRQRREKM